jgi:hypothetical protein
VGAADLIQFASRYVYLLRRYPIIRTPSDTTPTALQSSPVRVAPKSKLSSDAQIATQLPQRRACHPALVQDRTMTASYNSSSTKASQQQSSQLSLAPIPQARPSSKQPTAFQ